MRTHHDVIHPFNAPSQSAAGLYTLRCECLAKGEARGGDSAHTDDGYRVDVGGRGRERLCTRALTHVTQAWGQS